MTTFYLSYCPLCGAHLDSDYLHNPESPLVQRNDDTFIAICEQCATDLWNQALLSLQLNEIRIYNPYDDGT